ncbi:MAG: hypothetical protein DMG03_07565 [Acidobacteria bacterium]|nr:MAG: hypothetical protein DMG03_07565 [Acidobacteriota bacterium]
MRSRIHILIAVLVCGFSVMPARAQTAAPAGVVVSGVIVDQSAGVIPGAAVTLLGQAGAMRSTTSQADGTFSVDGVAPGAYVLRVELSGFETYQKPIAVTQEPSPPLKIAMRVATLETDVTVEADESADTFSTSNSSGETMRMDSEFRSALPIVADFFMGVVTNFFYPGAQGAQGASLVVDGIEGDQIEVPSAAIGTVRLNRNPYSALYQHPGQARLEVSTKRGRRSRYDGILEMANRSTLFAARNAFATTTQDLKRGLVQPTFGGPLPGKKSSFFFTGQRHIHDESGIVNAETLSGPVIANVPTGHDHTSVFSRIQAWPNDLNTFIVSYGFSGHDFSNRDAGGFNLAERGIAAEKHKHTLTFSHRLLRASQWQNDFLFGLINNEDHAGAAATAPAIDVSDAFSSGPSPTFTRATRQSFTLENTARYLGHTGHAFSFGARLRSDRVDAFDASNFAGTYEFADLKSYAAGTPLFFRINRGDPNAAFNLYGANGYVQDEVRVRPQLTLTFGLRYDWQSMVNDKKNLAPPSRRRRHLQRRFAPFGGRAIAARRRYPAAGSGHCRSVVPRPVLERRRRDAGAEQSQYCPEHPLALALGGQRQHRAGDLPPELDHGRVRVVPRNASVSLAQCERPVSRHRCSARSEFSQHQPGRVHRVHAQPGVDRHLARAGREDLSTVRAVCAVEDDRQHVGDVRDSGKQLRLAPGDRPLGRGRAASLQHDGRLDAPTRLPNRPGVIGHERSALRHHDRAGRQ